MLPVALAICSRNVISERNTRNFMALRGLISPRRQIKISSGVAEELGEVK
jgi:hypothetical protein